MPKQPSERTPITNRLNAKPPINSASVGSKPTFKPSDKSSEPDKNGQAAILDNSNSQQATLRRLTRSPLLPSQLSFVPPILMLRGLALALLIFSYAGTIALSQQQISLMQFSLYTVLPVLIAYSFVVSTSERVTLTQYLILGAIALEGLGVVSSILIIGFSAPLYFTIIPFYIVVAHVQASFSTRPALGLTFLVWLAFFLVLLTSNDPTVRSGFVILVLMLTIPFIGVTLVVRFIVREGQQRQQLIKVLENLQVSEERYRQVTDQANDVIFTLDETGSFTFVNPKMVEATGYAEEALLGRQVADILANENRQMITSALRRSEEAPPRKIAKTDRTKSRPDQTILSLEIIRRDGSKVLTEVTLAPITDEADKLSGWVGIARDVTERTRMRAQVERRNRDLSALNAVVSTAGQSLELDKLLNDVVTTLVEVLKADVAGITLIEEETRLLKVGAYKGLSDMVVRAVTNASNETGEGLTQAVVNSGQTVLIADMAEDPRAVDNSAVQSMGLRAFAAAPIKGREGILGVVSLISHQRGAFQQDDLDLLSSIGKGLAVAIENARLYGTSQSQVREMTCLAEIARAINLSESLGQTLTNIAESISMTLGYKSCAISLIDHHQLFIRAYGSYGMPPGFLERLNRLAQEKGLSREQLMQIPTFNTMEGNEPRVFQLNPTNPVEGSLAELSQEAITQKWATVLAVPLHVGGQSVGVIACYSTENVPPPDSELRLLTTIANQTSLAVQNAELFREQQRRADQLRAVSEIGRRIGSILSVDELLPFITRLLQQTFDYYLVSILLVDQDKPRELVLRAIHGWNPTPLNSTPGPRIAIDGADRGLLGVVTLSGEPAIVPDVSKDDRFVDYGEKGVVKSEMVVPIKRGAQVIGVIDLASTLLNGFDEIDLATMQALAEQVTIALENARLYTEVNRVVVQLTNANMELAEATRHKSEFLANMSHELRTPLNAIIGFSEVLQDMVFGELNDKQQRYVNNILTSGRHLLTLVNDVLDLAKVEAGRMELFPEEFAPDEAITDVEAIVTVSAAKKSLSIQNQFKANLPIIQADKSKYKQILYNLLSNAVKFTPEKGKITVGNYLHRESGQDYIAIWVKDTGIGIRREDSIQIFEEFKQVDSSYARQHQGTGLGLALSKRLVELHEGRIWVDSEPGVGSLFTFILPVEAVASQPAIASPAPTEAIDRFLEVQAQSQLERTEVAEKTEKSAKSKVKNAATSEATSEHLDLDSDAQIKAYILHPPALPLSAFEPPPSVLVIEDNARAAEILALYLTEGGYRVLQAASGAAALEKLAGLESLPVLITLDLVLPDQNGWEVLDRLKANPTYATIPVVVVTMTDIADAENHKGIFGCLSKPVAKADLLKMAKSATALLKR